MHIRSRQKVGNSKCLCQKRGQYKSDGVVSARSCLSSKLATTALYPRFFINSMEFGFCISRTYSQHHMKFQKTIFVKLVETGELFNNGIYFDMHEAIRKLLILHKKRDKEGKCIPFLKEMLVDTNSGWHGSWREHGQTWVFLENSFRSYYNHHCFSSFSS